LPIPDGATQLFVPVLRFRIAFVVSMLLSNRAGIESRAPAASVQVTTNKNLRDHSFQGKLPFPLQSSHMLSENHVVRKTRNAFNND
jgi:hypothetical protein